MGEAAKKPTAFDIAVTNTDRHVLYTALTQTLRCPLCKSGPLDTTEPVKFLKFAKLWDLFKLSDFEDVQAPELAPLLGSDDKLSVTIETDILRFIVETVLTLSNNLRSIAPALQILNTLISIAREHNIKLTGYSEEDEQSTKEISLTAEEVKLITIAILSPKLCENTFTLNNGSTVTHGAPIDQPHSVDEFNVYYKTIKQLNLLDVIAGKANYEEFDAEKIFEIDSRIATFLRDLISRRSTSTGLPAHKFIKLFNKLEELKK